jgi:hypothetical protein
MIRKLAFIFVALLEIAVALVVRPFAPYTGEVLMWALDPLHYKLRPPEPPDPATDLRVIYYQEAS